MQAGSLEAVGASVSVPFGETVTGPVVYSGTVGVAGAAAAEVQLCFLGKLDPAKVAGKIVICDRGTNARVEKSQAVAEAFTASRLDGDRGLAFGTLAAGTPFAKLIERALPL